MTKRLINKLTAALLLTLISQVFYAQKIIQGRVTSSATNDPLIEATIQVKGTLVGTTSDADGRYSVYVPSGAVSLVFAYSGYVSQEVPISNKFSEFV